ncbi:6,7-dimethyl-8-ribityllumazine synthase [Algihabitans albus]|uniref:6,7-dimethyl-8-ribityllumazine synthase n=1 Tax=Algihabitans albus TaxID=2164067 RepID=UPI000E5D5ECB|nr:6,7-dimethyl-8-ribityllumazine synthase [Algihabitans albus]
MNQKRIPPQISIAFVKAGWHAELVERCETGFQEELARRKRDDCRVDTFDVPGSFDIPLLAKKLAASGRFDAIVAAGFVVDGGIYRHDFVASTVIDALMQVQLETGVPVVSAVLTPHHFQEQPPHLRFFGEHFLVKGAEAARACLQIVETFGRLVEAPLSAGQSAAHLPQTG